MLRHWKVRLTYLIMLCSVCALGSCYRIDADNDYFTGLNELRTNNIDSCKKHLTYSSRKGSPLIARRSLETLAKIQDVQEGLDTCYRIVNTYKDMDAYLFIAKQLYANKEYQKLISLTDELAMEECPPELVGLRIYSLKAKGDSRYKDTLFKWNNNGEYTKTHYSLYNKLLFELDEADDSTVLYKFRAMVYSHDYAGAMTRLDELKYLIKAGTVMLNRYLLSDIGKACLYASKSYEHDYLYFTSIYNSEEADTGMRYRAAFYAARIMARNNNKERAATWYRNAIDIACTKEEYDNALWYYLDMSLASSISSAVELTIEYASKWRNAYYFDDYFDNLSLKLISAHRWQDYYNVYMAIRDYGSGESVARFAYISARLIEEGLITLESSDGIVIEDENNNRAAWAKEAFLRALTEGYESMYYRIMAARKLGYADSDFLLLPSMKSKEDKLGVGTEARKALDKLIKGYASHGLDELIYSEWQKSHNDISLEGAKLASTFLLNSSAKNTSYPSQSLRIIMDAVTSKHIAPTKIGTLKLLYPQNFISDISKACKEFGVKEYLILGIMRQESLFTPEAKSSVGALGLMQLMAPTAQEMARKLGDEDYDIMAISTNIRYGTYYIQQITQRLGENGILGIFAYNGGISRVRTWVKNADSDLGKSFASGTVPLDILLEILPYKETRDYGRLVTAAAALYASLYYDTPTAAVIDTLF